MIYFKVSLKYDKDMNWFKINSNGAFEKKKKTPFGMFVLMLKTGNKWRIKSPYLPKSMCSFEIYLISELKFYQLID